MLTSAFQDGRPLHHPLPSPGHRQHLPFQRHYHHLQRHLPVRWAPSPGLPVFIANPARSVSGLILIFLEIPFLLRICPTSPKFDAFMRRFGTNYMRAVMYGVMSLVQWLSWLGGATSLIAAAVVLLIAAIFYLLAGLRGHDFAESKTLGGQGVAQMIV